MMKNSEWPLSEVLPEPWRNWKQKPKMNILKQKPEKCVRPMAAGLCPPCDPAAPSPVAALHSGAVLNVMCVYVNMHGSLTSMPRLIASAAALNSLQGLTGHMNKSSLPPNWCIFSAAGLKSRGCISLSAWLPSLIASN